jgi:hypothetical protein
MHSYILWIATSAYAFHILEEFTFDWKTWAGAVLKLPVNYVHFAIVNGIVGILGIACPMVGWNCPIFALSFPAQMLVNATFMHLLPFILTKGRFSPGLGTAILLFYPIGIWCFYGAYQDGVLDLKTGIGSFVVGAACLALAIVMLKLRLLPYFQQEPPKTR